MCFGNSVTTETKNETKDTKIPEWLTGAAVNNIGNLFGQSQKGYTPYTGQKVAGLSGDEGNAFDIFRTLAGSSNPYTSTLEGTFGNAATAGPQSVHSQGVLDGRSVQDYMDPNLKAVLAPQLADINHSFDDQQKQNDAKATMSGAFGDIRSGFDKESTERLRNDATSRATGNALNGAYDRALAAKTGDINREMGAESTNAGLSEQALMRALQGGTALQGLDKYNTGRMADLATLLSGAGATQRGINDKTLQGQYEEYAKQQGSLMDWAKLLTGAINGAPHDTNQTGVTTTQKPDNTGWGLLGTLGGAGIKAAPALMAL